MEEKKQDASCATGCGLKCGCCACKAVRGALLLLVGGVIGFFIARGCPKNKMCPVSEMPSSAAPAAAPAKKAK